MKSRLDEGLIENCSDAGEVTAIEALKVIDDEEHPADSIQDQVRIPFSLISVYILSWNTITSSRNQLLVFKRIVGVYQPVKKW